MSNTSRIIIAGAGPTGLTAAILLRQQGYDPFVLDRRPSQTGYPAAHVANTRSQARRGVSARAGHHVLADQS